MKIAPGVYSMGQEEGGRVHAYLLESGSKLTLIDTLYDDDGKRVLLEIESLGYEPTALKHIILTHAHRSHVGGVAALKAASGAIVCSHEWEVDIVAGRRPATRVGLVPRRPFQVYRLQLGLALGLGKHQSCDVDQRLKAGDHIGPLQVVETPGHTPGSLSFWWADRRALFAGDVITTWPEVTAGWPGLTLDNGRNLRSVHDLTDFGNAEILCTGHGDPITHDAAGTIRALAE
jgi:glyoxylase-like metal-dependent hydrolase (beta-lactamase superfamily II)